MKRIRNIVWPWHPNSSINFGFEETLILKHPREEAEIISIGVFAGELRVYLEEHISDRIGRDRTLKGFAPSRAGRFDIPDDATFVVSVPLSAHHAAMHVFELQRPSSLKTDPFYRPYSLSPLDPEPAPHTPAHQSWAIREALRIKHMNEAIDRGMPGTDSLSIGYRGTRVENAGR